MKTPKDVVLIKVNQKEKQERKIEGTDITLKVLTHFNEYHEDHCVHHGTVVVCPDKISGGGEVEIKEGDKIYTHHFLTHEENKADELLPETYRMTYDEIYCKIVDGEIEMLGHWNFLEPVEEESKTASGLIITANPKKIEGVAIMRKPSKYMQSIGIEDGTKLLFKKNAGYVILVEGKKYYRVIDEHIFGIYG